VQARGQLFNAEKKVTIVLLYIIFAAISTLINIGSQILSMWFYDGPYAVEASILIGTGTGLPLRYILEKRYIFSFRADDIRHDSRLFLLYSFMALFTTAIFWGTEYTFHLNFKSELMRYLGGVIGLSIGFYIKYWLDRKYVFVRQNKKVRA
jgi:putative flippase GtrA